MNKRERLAICSSCINRKLDYDHGYVCQLTGRFADYEGTCKHFSLDQTVDDIIKVRTKDRPFVPLFDPVPAPEEVETKTKAQQTKKPSQVALKKLRRYQSFLYALIGGILFTTIASVGWAYITAMTGYQAVYMALGVGLLVGIAVRFFGAGVNRIFGILAALLALAGSLLGYFLCQAGFPVEVQLAGIIKVPGYLKPELMLNTMWNSFVLLDLVFYGLAALLAYFLAIRRINSRKMAKLEHDGYKGAPALYWLRLPLILAGILLPALYGYTLTSDDSGGYNTLYYDSGKKMSEGEMRNGLEMGEWTSWHENENIKSTGFYVEGRKDSLWQWYDESGILTGAGRYTNDVEDGIWMHYYPDGVVSDSGSYLEGMKEGVWKYYHDNGSLKYSVNYKGGKLCGEKILLSSSGDVVNIEYYEDGVLMEKD